MSKRTVKCWVHNLIHSEKCGHFAMQTLKSNAISIIWMLFLIVFYALLFFMPLNLWCVDANFTKKLTQPFYRSCTYWYSLKHPALRVESTFNLCQTTKIRRFCVGLCYSMQLKKHLVYLLFSGRRTDKALGMGTFFNVFSTCLLLYLVVSFAWCLFN